MKKSVLIMMLSVLLAMVLTTGMVFAADKEQLSEVSITVEKPVAGTDCDVAPVVMLPPGAPYEVEAKGWISEDGKQEPPTYFKFEDGKKYTMWITIMANDGYDYLENLDSITVNVSGGTLKKKVDVYNSPVTDYSALVVNVEVGCGNAPEPPEDDKFDNTIKAKNKTVTFKYSKLKKKTQTAKAVLYSNNQGKVTYKVKQYDKKAKKKITIGSAGKVTVKKGLKKGTYKLKVSVKDAGTDMYAAKTVTATLTVKVK